MNKCNHFVGLLETAYEQPTYRVATDGIYERKEYSDAEIDDFSFCPRCGDELDSGLYFKELNK